MLVQLFHLMRCLIEWEDNVLRAGVDHSRALLSPLLSLALMRFLHRWSMTYLFPDPRYSAPALLKEYGSDTRQGGKELLQLVLEKVLHNCTFYRWDADVCAASAQLFLSLSNHSRLFSVGDGGSDALLCTSDTFARLMECFEQHATADSSASSPVSIPLPEKCKQLMARALTQSCRRTRADLLYQMLSSISAQGEEVFKQIGQENASHPALIAHVCHILDISIGVVRAGAFSAPTFEAVWQYSEGLLPGVVRLAEVYVRRASVVVVGVLSLLSELFAVVCDACEEYPLELLVRHSTAAVHALGECAGLRVRGGAASEEEAHTEAVELRLLLELLLHAASSLSDSSTAGPLVQSALQRLLPKLSASSAVLDEPALGIAFYRPLQCLCAAPAMMIQLPSPTFMNVLQCLQFGLTNQNPTIARLAIESFFLLAKFNFDVRQRTGELGLAPQIAEEAGLLGNMQRVMLEHVTRTAVARSNLSLVADCTAYLVMVDFDTFKEYISVLSGVLAHDGDRQRLQSLAGEWLAVLDHGLEQCRSAFFQMRTYVFWKLKSA
eukprot:TRINITY_DN12344_c0_g1_i2.p1 TRINITY_DN12344_c0_g1~~TRINITY_DN12344_c0_g1_i2.p1  ORF type:complete len:617 (-),score=206.78 TRINITY_DN12344_c0_g1_i2:196-1848(-)